MSEPENPKDPAAVSLGRRGGLKGGVARAAKMTPAERSASASKAARARWGLEPSPMPPWCRHPGHCRRLGLCLCPKGFRGTLVYMIAKARAAGEGDT